MIEASLIARRRLGEVLLRLHLLALRLVADLERGQAAAVLVVAVDRVVAVFLVEFQEAVELHHRAGRPQRLLLVGGHDIDRDLVELGAFHLRGEGALPHQVIELELVVAQETLDLLGRRKRSVGRIASCASWAFLATVL
jgi:hypothetical protein